MEALALIFTKSAESCINKALTSSWRCGSGKVAQIATLLGALHATHIDERSLDHSFGALCPAATYRVGD